MSKAEQYKPDILKLLKQGMNLAQIADELLLSPHAVRDYYEQYRKDGTIIGDARTLNGIVVEGVAVVTKPELASKCCGFPNCTKPIYRREYGHAGSRYCETHHTLYHRRRHELAKTFTGKLSYGYADFEDEMSDEPDMLTRIVTVNGSNIRFSRVLRDVLEKLYYVRRSDVTSLVTSKSAMQRLVTVGCAEKVDGDTYAITQTGIEAAELLWGLTPETQVMDMPANERKPASNGAPTREEVKLIEPLPHPAPETVDEPDETPSTASEAERFFRIDISAAGLSVSISGDWSAIREWREDKLYHFFKTIAEQIHTLRTAKR